LGDHGLGGVVAQAVAAAAQRLAGRADAGRARVARVVGLAGHRLGAVADDEAAELAARLAFAFAREPRDRRGARIVIVVVIVTIVVAVAVFGEQVAVERAFLDRVERLLVSRDRERVVLAAQRDRLRGVVRIAAREHARAHPLLA